MRQLAGSGGAVSLARSYQPYGKVLASDGSGETSYGFTGEWTDSYIELVNLRSRMYSPGTGRFLTKDTWQGNYIRPLSLNRWNYVEANPVNLSDPSGHSSCSASHTCDPDITDWVMTEMKNHYDYGVKIAVKVAAMKRKAQFLTFLRGIQGCLPYALLFEVATEAPFNEIVSEFKFPKTNLPIGITPISYFQSEEMINVLAVLEYGLYGLAVDYSNFWYQNNIWVENPEDRSMHPVVTLCDRCIDSSDLGNIMFGLGGVARGYQPGPVYLSASLFNGLNDKGDFLKVTLGSVDGRGSVPGWIIGRIKAFNNRSVMCDILNTHLWDEFPYNDNSYFIKDYLPSTTKFDGPHTNPSSLIRLGSGGDTIPELQFKVENFLDRFFSR